MLFRSIALRTNGYKVEVNFDGSTKVANALKKALRKGCRLAIFLGEDEYNNGTVTIKDLKENKQETISSEDMLLYVDDLFDNGGCTCGCESGECTCGGNN